MNRIEEKGIINKPWLDRVCESHRFVCAQEAQHYHNNKLSAKYYADHLCITYLPNTKQVKMGVEENSETV
jgi:hypothetical protein